MRAIILPCLGEILEWTEIILNQANIKDPDYWIAMVISTLLILKELRRLRQELSSRNVAKLSPIENKPSVSCRCPTVTFLMLIAVPLTMNFKGKGGFSSLEKNNGKGRQYTTCFHIMKIDQSALVVLGYNIHLGN